MYRAISFSIASTMFLISFLILPSCDFTAHPLKPLKNIEKYQVTLFVSPYGDLNAENLQKLLKERLASLGHVIEAKTPISEEIPMLFISLEPEKSTIPSTIQVLARAKVLKNDYELTTSIWSYPFSAERTSIPVERDGKIFFKEKENPPISQSDPLNSLLNAFVEEYGAAHPKQAPITFLISK